MSMLRIHGGCYFLGASALLMYMALASESSFAQGMDRWLLNQNQQAYRIFDETPEQAAQIFTDPRWKALALYKSEQYEKSLENYPETTEQSDLYNKGNILAHLGMIKEAIEAYDRVLEMNPDHTDARHNRDYLRSFQQPSSQQQSQQQDEQQNQQQGQQQNQQQSSQQNKSNQNQNQNKDSQGQDQRSDGNQNEDVLDPSDAHQAQSEQSQEQSNQSNQIDQPLQSDQEQQSSSLKEVLRKLENDESLFWKRKFKRQYHRRVRTR